MNQARIPGGVRLDLVNASAIEARHTQSQAELARDAEVALGKASPAGLKRLADAISHDLPLGSLVVGAAEAGEGALRDERIKAKPADLLARIQRMQDLVLGGDPGGKEAVTRAAKLHSKLVKALEKAATEVDDTYAGQQLALAAEAMSELVQMSGVSHGSWKAMLGRLEFLGDLSTEGIIRMAGKKSSDGLELVAHGPIPFLVGYFAELVSEAVLAAGDFSH